MEQSHLKVISTPLRATTCLTALLSERDMLEKNEAVKKMPAMVGRLYRNQSAVVFFQI